MQFGFEQLWRNIETDVIYMNIALGQGYTIPFGQKCCININNLSLLPVAVILLP